MHDDLIDAVDWAVAQGIADPKRVGFFGGSYGGYSALMAATKTPEVFACIVDLFGISNLITFMATIPPYWGPWFSIWKNRLGDPATEAGRAFLAERSPINHLDRATKPILIAQGMRDVRVVAANPSRWWPRSSSVACPSPTSRFPTRDMVSCGREVAAWHAKSVCSPSAQLSRGGYPKYTNRTAVTDPSGVCNVSRPNLPRHRA